MKIGLDLDGVLYPWHDSIYRYFTEFKGFSGGEVEFWDYFRDLPVPAQEYYVSLPFMYLNITPRASALQTLPKLAELGEIYYITSRRPDLHRVTLKFFNIYDLPFKDNLYFTEDKASIIRMRGIDCYLDDLTRYVDQVANITDAYLMAMPHNTGQREGYKVVNSIKEFYERISQG